jgi:hypothetical protein
MKFKFCFQNFVVPENLMRNNFEGNVKVLGDANGVFKVIYVNAIDEELINEAKGCLSNSQITASTYNGAVYSKYNITFQFH